MSRTRTARAVVLAAAVTGCAYYNGLYNANRLAKDAARAEREERPGEASALWAQAAVKAESVVARYPKSKHRDDALLLQGRALFGSDQCRRAVAPLAIAVDSSLDRSVRERASLLVGRCRLRLGQPDEALRTLSALADAEDSATVREALLWRGRAFMALGDNERAARDLAASGRPEASLWLAVAYGRLASPDRAVDVLLGQLSRRYVERSWLATLDTLGRMYPMATAAVVDSVVRRRGLSPGQRARVLLEDGSRWEGANDHRRATARFAAASAAAPDSVEGRQAGVRRLLADIRLATDLRQAPALLDSLEKLAEGSMAGVPAGSAVQVLRRVVQVLARDSVAGADLEMFMLAELLRDSVGARPLAIALFQEIPRRRPGSVIAPKALLAAAVIDVAARDSLVALVQARYPDSPYALALRGVAGGTFAAVEDSLFALLRGDERDAVLEERGRGGRVIPDSVRAKPKRP